MRITNYASCIVTFGDQVLLQHRSMEKASSPGLWSLPGGQVQRDEFIDPMAAALRELFEETGLTPNDIETPRLRYISPALKGEALQWYFDYEIKLREMMTPFGVASEGELYWKTADEVAELAMPGTLAQELPHFFANRDAKQVFYGCANDDAPIDWLPLDLRYDAKVRNMSGILLTHGSECLMLHRSQERHTGPGQWTHIGGHLKLEESRVPHRGALRKLEVDAFIYPEQVTDIRWTGLAVVPTGDELRLHYAFAGDVDERVEAEENNDGEFVWTAREEIAELPMPPTMQALIKAALSPQEPLACVQTEGGLLRVYHLHNVQQGETI